jgi:DDE superfamily endonuclease
MCVFLFQPPKLPYQAWTQTQLSSALMELKNKTLPFNECSRKYKIPPATLNRHFYKKNEPENVGRRKMGHPNIFTTEIEKELVGRILYLEKYLRGLTIKEIRHLAYETAEKNKIPNNFNAKLKMAGKGWYYNFMKRHPTLSLRQPEAVSLARAKGFNRENVDHFYRLLKKIVEQNNFDGTQIFNVDEKGFTEVAKKSPKIVTRKGKQRVCAISSAERGSLTTFVGCVSAAGMYVPPMFIFKRSISQLHQCNEFNIDSPIGSLIVGSQTGYIDASLFVRWLIHFIDYVKPTVEKKVLILLDGHTTHSRNLEAVTLAQENGIIMLQLPSHTTHRLQPLDVGLFKPMQTYFDEAVRLFHVKNPWAAVTKYQICSLVNFAYGKAATLETAANCFRGTGIWPVNPLVFNDEDFAVADALLNDSGDTSTSSLKVPIDLIWPMQGSAVSTTHKKQNAAGNIENSKNTQKAVELNGK